MFFKLYRWDTNLLSKYIIIEKMTDWAISICALFTFFAHMRNNTYQNLRVANDYSQIKIDRWNKAGFGFEFTKFHCIDLEKFDS